MKKRNTQTPNPAELWEKITSVEAKVEEWLKELGKLKVHTILLKNGIKWGKSCRIRKLLPTKPGLPMHLRRSPSQEEWHVTDVAGHTTIIKNPWDIPKGRRK
jgi:hypothetical protein|tara:strand:- start:38 stop:343 length:306 start_codon:yes stop_codon:yes gene_type:complete